MSCLLVSGSLKQNISVGLTQRSVQEMRRKVRGLLLEVLQSTLSFRDAEFGSILRLGMLAAASLPLKCARSERLRVEGSDVPATAKWLLYKGPRV